MSNAFDWLQQTIARNRELYGGWTMELAPAAPPAAVTPPAATVPVQTPPAQETDWKAEARKWESRAKENSSAADRLAEIEEASKTEAQKQADALAKAQAQVKEYQGREQVAAWKTEVAAATGVPANVLAGATKEEIEAHAESLKALITPSTAAGAAAHVVSTIGNVPQTPANVPLKDQIAAAEKAGDKDLVGQLKAMQLGTTQ